MGNMWCSYWSIKRMPRFSFEPWIATETKCTPSGYEVNESCKENDLTNKTSRDWLIFLICVAHLLQSTKYSHLLAKFFPLIFERKKKNAIRRLNKRKKVRERGRDVNQKLAFTLIPCAGVGENRMWKWTEKESEEITRKNTPRGKK